MDNARVFLIVLLAVPVAGGLMIGQPERSPAQEARMLAAQAEERARDDAEALVRPALKDPESATFRHLKPGLCGYVNARNGFGGYTGNQRFIIAMQGPVLEEQVGNMREFDRTWNERCLSA